MFFVIFSVIGQLNWCIILNDFEILFFFDELAEFSNKIWTWTFVGLSDDCGVSDLASDMVNLQI